MSDKGYTVTDRRGGKNPEPAEACRCCGSPKVHTREYNQPTMQCIEFLRHIAAEMDLKCQEWARSMEAIQKPVTQAQPEDKNMPRRFRWKLKDGKHPNGSTSEWRYGLYFPQTDLCVGDMGNRSTGVPTFPDVEWIDPKPEWA